MKNFKILTILTIFLLSPGVGLAEDLSSFHQEEAHDLVACSEKLFRGDTMKSRRELVVKTPRWTRKRIVDSWSSSTYEKSLVRVVEPIKEKGTASLRIGLDAWHYLSKAERTIKLAPSMMLQLWLGSDFTNDDLLMMSSSARDYYQRIVEEEVIDGKEVSVVKLIPKPKAPVVWGGLLTWIEKGSCIPMKTEFYDEDEVLLRVIEYFDVKEMDGRTIPTTVKAHWIDRPGRESFIKTLEIDYDIEIPQSVFTIQNLEEGY